MSEGIEDLMNDDDLNDEDLEVFLQGAIQAKFDEELKQELKNDLRKDFAVFKKTTNQYNKARRRRLIYYFLTAAAAVLLILVGFNLFDSPTASARELAAAYLAESDIYHSGSTKGSTPNEELRQQAIIAFNEKNYAAAHQYFSQIEVKNEEDYFYQGLALLLDKKYERALAELQLVANTGSVYATEAGWYLAIAHLLMDNNAGAAEALSEIKDSSWNQEKIQALLQALNKSQR